MSTNERAITAAYPVFRDTRCQNELLDWLSRFIARRHGRRYENPNVVADACSAPHPNRDRPSTPWMGSHGRYYPGYCLCCVTSGRAD